MGGSRYFSLVIKDEEGRPTDKYFPIYFCSIFYLCLLFLVQGTAVKE
jgi:hypothetical protein